MIITRYASEDSQKITRERRSKAGRLHLEIVNAAWLSPEHQTRWLEFAGLQPFLDSPCFDPEFVCGIAKYIPSCKVVILRRGSDVVGYVPFLKENSEDIARPIPMCDYQPIISGPEQSFDAREIVSMLGFKGWHVENLLSSQRQNLKLGKMCVGAGSPRIDLTAGYAGYLAQMTAEGKGGRNIKNKLRLLRRDHGELRLIHEQRDTDCLARLLSFKAERYAPAGQFEPWVGKVLANYLTAPGGRISGQISIFTAGDNVIAYIYWLKVRSIMYYWFPTFNPAYRRYSPGMIALWLLIKDLSNMGCNQIDLGPGGESYKSYFANSHVDVVSGYVDRNPFIAAARLFCNRLRSSQPAQRLVKPAIKWMQRSSAKPR